MIVNEPQGCAPNAIFKHDSLVIAKNLQAGSEVFVHYGDENTYIRDGYDISNNRYIRNAKYTPLIGMKYMSTALHRAALHPFAQVMNPSPS